MELTGVYTVAWVTSLAATKQFNYVWICVFYEQVFL